jgi:hypothetical protein
MWQYFEGNILKVCPAPRNGPIMPQGAAADQQDSGR